MTNENVGGSGLPRDAQLQVADLIARLQERYEFSNGATAAYWAVAAVLASQIKGGLK